MSLTSVTHVIFKARIIALLNRLCPKSLAVSGFPLNTSGDAEVVDVGLLETSQISALKGNITSAIAPKICIEVLSSSNTRAEMSHKKTLYFEKDAEEFWVCDQLGKMSFYDQSGELGASGLVGGFPSQVEL